MNFTLAAGVLVSVSVKNLEKKPASILERGYHTYKHLRSISLISKNYIFHLF